MKQIVSNPAGAKESGPLWWMEIDPLADIEHKKEVKEVISQLEQNDLGAIEFSDDFFDKMHDKIMKEVTKEEVKIQPQPLWEKYRKKFKQTISVMSCLIVMAIAGQTQTHLVEADVKESAQISRALEQKGAASESSLLTHQNADDFFVDLGQESLNHMTQEQIDRLVAQDSQIN